MPVNHRRLTIRRWGGVDLGGRGFLAGQAPTGSDLDAPDGRFKKLNVPAIGRIVALERSTLRVAGATLSKADGTWRINGLALGVRYMVIGLDDQGQVNAAIQDWVLAAVDLT